MPGMTTYRAHHRRVAVAVLVLASGGCSQTTARGTGSPTGSLASPAATTSTSTTPAAATPSRFAAPASAAPTVSRAASSPLTVQAATAPCSIAALRRAADDQGAHPLLLEGQDGLVYDEATLHACRGGYALAEFSNSGGSCFTYWLFTATGAKWKIRDASCIQLDTPAQAPIFTAGELRKLRLNPRAIQSKLQNGTRRRVVGLR